MIKEENDDNDDADEEEEAHVRREPLAMQSKANMSPPGYVVCREARPSTLRSSGQRVGASNHPVFSHVRFCASSTSHLKCMSCGSRGLYQVKNVPKWFGHWMVFLRTNTFHLRLEAVLDRKTGSNLRHQILAFLLHLICKTLFGYIWIPNGKTRIA